MSLILFLLIVLTGLGIWEMTRHAYHRRRVPIRIHVNGSRGKSSVTRLIAAGLRAGGIRTLAKTTGSAACLIHADGSESPVRRRGGPNIREQLAIFRAAVAEGAQALVLECMAVRPDLQWVCEHRIVNSTLGVITNTRPDHLEVMGPRLEDVANSLAGTIPRNGQLLTADPHFADYFTARARQRGSSCSLTSAEAVSAAELSGFKYFEFADNVSLALSACETLDVPRETALQGMYTVEPDVGALLSWTFRHGDKELCFYNAFAANDPESYRKIWERLQLNTCADEVVILMNLRGDRQRRSKDLAPLLGRELQARHYLLIGEQTVVFGEMLRRRGLAPESLSDLGGASAVRIWTRLWELNQGRLIVVGIGNIAGVGNDLLALMRTKEIGE
ncbi:MAG: poly-gamma-glutamate synthase PgsB [bacterium]